MRTVVASCPAARDETVPWRGAACRRHLEGNQQGKERDGGEEQPVVLRPDARVEVQTMVVETLHALERVASACSAAAWRGVAAGANLVAKLAMLGILVRVDAAVDAMWEVKLYARASSSRLTPKPTARGHA